MCSIEFHAVIYGARENGASACGPQVMNEHISKGAHHSRFRILRWWRWCARLTTSSGWIEHKKAFADGVNSKYVQLQTIRSLLLSISSDGGVGTVNTFCKQTEMPSVVARAGLCCECWPFLHDLEIYQ